MVKALLSDYLSEKFKKTYTYKYEYFAFFLFDKDFDKTKI